MPVPSEWRCPLAAVPPGHTAKFRLSCPKHKQAAQAQPPLDDLEGFVVNHGGHFYAYVNRCAHVGTPLDLWPNEFLSEDGSALVCATHGALYEPATGLCTAGPCVGAALTSLPLRRDGDELVVSCPHP
jgi:nitrite reductase/ring-hydroxylating ferredoxin subunit